MIKSQAIKIMHGVWGLLAVILMLNFTAEAAEPPYGASQVIRQVSFDEASHIRMASGSDNWPITWGR